MGDKSAASLCQKKVTKVIKKDLLANWTISVKYSMVKHTLPIKKKTVQQFSLYIIPRCDPIYELRMYLIIL